MLGSSPVATAALGTLLVAGMSVVAGSGFPNSSIVFPTSLVPSVASLIFPTSSVSVLCLRILRATSVISGGVGTAREVVTSDAFLFLSSLFVLTLLLCVSGPYAKGLSFWLGVVSV